MVASLPWLPLVAINASFAALACWHAACKAKGRRPRVDVLVTGISFGVSAMLVPFILDGTGTTREGKELLFSIGTAFFCSLLGVLLAIVIRRHRACTRDLGLKKKGSYEAFLAALPVDDGLARDNARKRLHVVISASLAAIHGISFVAGGALQQAGILQELGVSWQGAARGITLLVLWGFSYMISLQDVLRLHAFHCIPPWGRRWLASSLERKERDSFTAAVPFLLGHVPLLLAPLPVFFSVSFSASLADAAASYVGKRSNGRTVRRGLRKTWAGVVAGTLVSLACAMAWMLAFHPPAIAFPFSLAYAGLFGFADSCNEGLVDDNAVNTFLLGAVAWMLHAWLAGAS